MSKIDPLTLAWDRAVWYRKEAVIKARAAQAGEVVNGETCEAGDQVNVTNPARPYRIEAARVQGEPPEYTVVSEPRRVVFTTKAGHIDAPWPGHEGWDVDAGEAVAEVVNSKGKAEYYPPGADFRNYKPCDPPKPRR